MREFLMDEHPMIVERSLARIIGVNEAIVIQQIHYWLVKNKENNINFKEGRYWTFNSMQKWHDEVFDFWSESTLRRIFTSLEKKGILIVGNFNKMGFDRTKWYSIDYDKLNEIADEKIKYKQKINEVCNKIDNNSTNMNNCNYSKEENAINQDEQMKNINLTKCSCSDVKDEFSQVEQSNTNNYTNNTKCITQPLPNGIGVCKVKKEDEILKEFLENEYTEEYARRINEILKLKGKDSSYLQEKIKITKIKNPRSKCGYLYNAVKYNYMENIDKLTGDFCGDGNDFKYGNSFKNNCYGSKNKFKNFEETVNKYTKEELDERVRAFNIKKYGE